MSAPVPLNSGCCSAPCPTSPTTAVPGPAGENAFSFTTAAFTQPIVGGNVVISLTHDGWVIPGQTVFIGGGGFYTVSAVSGLSVTITNTGIQGNAAPGILVANGAKVSPGGVGGNTGNAFTTTSANFTQPASSANVTVSVLNTNWMAVGETLFVATAGYYTIFSINDAVTVVLTNLGYPGNAAPATVINSPQQVTPGGIRGATGATGVSSLNAVSPTTTKGDIIVDNGASSPSASDVRLGVGTDGKALCADSAQPTGLNYVTIQPNSVANDRNIAIYNGTSGKPTPLQDSKMLITSDGALQSTPTGGNARGTKAVDLQVDRLLATQVASGDHATVLGGKNNTAGGQHSVVAGGTTNIASGDISGCICGSTNQATGNSAFVGGGQLNVATNTSAAVCGGNANTASGSAASVCGGATNTASGTDSFVGGGTQNTANFIYSAIVGGIGNTASNAGAVVLGGQSCVANLYGEVSHGSFQIAAPGDAQTNELMWAVSTTDATAGVEMFLDGPGGSARAVVGLNNTWAFVIRLVGRSSAGVCAVWETKGGIQNVAGTVTLIAANTQSVIVDGTVGSWGVTGNVAVTADNTNKSLKIAVTGAGATNIRWVAHARIVQVNF